MVDKRGKLYSFGRHEQYKCVDDVWLKQTRQVQRKRNKKMVYWTAYHRVKNDDWLFGSRNVK